MKKRKERRTEGDRRRGDEMAYERERERGERERVGGKKGCFVSAAARLTERMENRTECALCVFVCVPVCVFLYTCCVLQPAHG